MVNHGSPTLWVKAVEKHKKRLSKEDLQVVLGTTEPHELLWRLKTSSNQAYRTSPRIEKIESGLEKYSAFFSVFGATLPEASGLLWGSIDLVHQVSSTSNISRQVNEMGANLIESICAAAPRLRTYERLFDGMQDVNAALVSLYDAKLDCIHEINEYIKQNSSKSKFKPHAEPFEVEKKLGKIRELRQKVEEEARVANMELHYKWHEEIRSTLSRVSIKPKGRVDVLAQLKSNLSNPKKEQKSVTIHGMGGVGKTQIALKYIYDNINRYEGIFWMSADSLPKLQTSFVEAAKKLELVEASSQKDSESVARRLKEWMEESKSEWLLVFDNVEDLDILGPFWPVACGGTIIITSRNPSAFTLTKAAVLIKPLPIEDSERLFMSIITPPGGTLNQETEGAWARRIVERLGHLPLAISQVAHYMVQSGCSVDDFYELYKESLKSADTFGALDPEINDLFYKDTLATVWKISLKKLSGNATSLLRILSCLDPDGVQEFLLRGGSREFDELKNLGKTKMFVDAVKELMRNGLISKSLTMRDEGIQTTARKVTPSLVVHRLVQETVFHQQDPKGQSRTFSIAVDICLKSFPHPTRANFRLMHRWPECERLLPHLLALNSRLLDADSLVPGSCLGELFLYGSWYLYERRSPELALPLLASAKRICDNPGTPVDWFLRSRVLSCFGCVLFECSRYAESESYFREALRIRLHHVGADDILLAHGYQDIALPVTAQGRYSEAIALQQQGLDVVSLNPDEFTRRDMRFHINHNMARTYEAAGQPEMALGLHFDQGDEFGNGLRQEVSESGAVNLYAIGNCYLSLSDRKGVDYHMRSLKIRKTLVGERGFYYGVSLHKLGRILMDSATWDEAEEAFQQARDIFANSSDAHRELARSTYYLSIAKREQGDYTAAAKLLDEAQKLREEIMHAKSTGSNKDYDELVIYIHR